MPSHTPRSSALFVAFALAISACGGTSPSPVTSSAPSAAPSSTVPVSPTAPPTASAVTGGWTLIAPAGAGFTVEMPGQPKFQTQSVPTQIGTTDLQIGAWSTSQGAYALSWGVYPSDLGVDAATSLEGARDGAVKNVNGKLVDDKAISREGLPGREFSANVNGGSYRAEVFLDGRKLIQLAVVAATGSEAAFDAQRYFESFKKTG